MEGGRKMVEKKVEKSLMFKMHWLKQVEIKKKGGSINVKNKVNELTYYAVGRKVEKKRQKREKNILR